MLFIHWLSLNAHIPQSQISLLSGMARPANLVCLLCALQASLFFWCRKNMAGSAVQGLLLKCRLHCCLNLLSLTPSPLAQTSRDWSPPVWLCCGRSLPWIPTR